MNRWGIGAVARVALPVGDELIKMISHKNSIMLRTAGKA